MKNAYFFSKSFMKKMKKLSIDFFTWVNFTIMRILFAQKLKYLMVACCVWGLCSCSLAIKRAKRLYAETEQSKVTYDAIIVPGVPFLNGRWDSVMKARVLWSVYLYKNHYTKNIIYSGAAVYSHFYEALIMGLYAQQLGVDKKHILYDTLAKHSTENIYYGYLIAKCNGFRSIALATDPFQSILLRSYTQSRFKSPINHVPVNFDILKTMNHEQITIDSMQAYKPGFVSIYQQEGFLKRLRGTMGRQVYYGPDGVLGKLCDTCF